MRYDLPQRHGVPLAVLITCAVSGLVALAAQSAQPPVTVVIDEWSVPAQNSRPHDPAWAPDGVWYTDQYANALGRVNPTTGKIQEFKLPDDNPPQGHGPHGLVADRDGNIWYTANYAGLIGKLDPKTGKVIEFKMPDARVRDPHTPIFDQQGTLWFTAQQAGFVGKLDPKTGAVTLAEAPARSLPYGMVITSKGVPVFDLFGTNAIGAVDPVTMAVTTYPLPDPAARPRRIAITKEDVIYYTDYARGYLGRLDLTTRQVKEYPSPGGRASQPYAIAVTPDGIVWYAESGVQPNTIVRFDPKTDAMFTWPIPSGGGVVRNMTQSPDGKTLWLACSGVKKIARVTIQAR